MSGLFPFFKDQQIVNGRLDGKIINGREREREYFLILTECEKQSIVTFAKNKNWALKGIKHSVLTKLVINVFKIRRSCANKGVKGSRKYMALLKNV